jgi:hypothetical protein
MFLIGLINTFFAAYRQEMIDQLGTRLSGCFSFWAIVS